jgi:septal ring factor EnvC (AmiA/AmiB activator)
MSIIEKLLSAIKRQKAELDEVERELERFAREREAAERRIALLEAQVRARSAQ